MSPDEKAKLNEVLKQLGSKHTVDELETLRKRAFRTIEEWASLWYCTRRET